MRDSTTGRSLVMVVVFATLALSITVMAMTNSAFEPDRVTTSVIRLLIQVGLCFALLNGANWARWLMAILYAIGGVGALASGLSIGPGNIGGMMLLVMAMVYLGSFVILAFVPSVNDFYSSR
jgi:peptidoglycan/LPS O-acetylase OafA/YrhL